MHPLFQDRERLLLYFGGWLAAGLFVVALLSADRFPLTAAAALVTPPAILEAFFSLSVWYVVRALPLRSTPGPRLLIVHGVAALAASAGLLLLVQGWAWILARNGMLAGAFDTGDLRLIFGAGVFIYLLTIAVHYLMAAFLDSRASERRSFESQILARESELKALRAQIDPHFLFNSLNSISALTTADPGRARTMTIQLADFFRASVAAGRRSSIPLSEEVDLVRQYLAIEQVRFGDRLRTLLDVAPDTLAEPVPPLLLQPVVENAVKHGIATLVDGGTIEVRAARLGSSFTITVSNPFDAEGSRRPVAGTSFGLAAVRDRVHASAPREGRVDAAAAGTTFTVRITLPRR